jgi:hypothetical protein
MEGIIPIDFRDNRCAVSTLEIGVGGFAAD